MNELDIYQRQAMGRPVGIGSRPALLVVDLIEGFVDPKHFGGGNIQAALTAARRLLHFARERSWPIAHTRLVYADDGSDAGAFARKIPGLLNLRESDPLSRIVSAVAPITGELVLRKQQASAFFDTGLAGWLRWQGVDTLAVCGCTTSGCVRASVVDAVSHNLRTLVPIDAVGDRALGPHEANLFDMGQKYADLTTVEQLMASFGATPDTLPTVQIHR